MNDIARPFKVVRTDRELEMQRVDTALRRRGPPRAAARRHAAGRPGAARWRTPTCC